MTAYKLAFATESGSWDIAETFEADNDAEAAEYAEKTCAAEYPERVDDWYLLDDHNLNINGEECARRI